LTQADLRPCSPRWDTRDVANPKRPRDPNQRAKLIVDIATGESDAPRAPSPKNAAAVELGRRGGAKGGKARAAKLTPQKRSDIARKAAAARWSRD
jgi:hypothetical protein